MPDVEIPAELIREEITEDHMLSLELEKLDPYMGNLLEIFSQSEEEFLIFPTGDTGSKLSEYRFMYERAYSNILGRCLRFLFCRQCEHYLQASSLAVVHISYTDTTTGLVKFYFWLVLQVE